MNDMVVKTESKIVQFDKEKTDLLKRTICRGASDEELELFIHACKRTGLDPFMKQVYAVKRWDSSLKREVMTVQTSIDGYRLIAERTGKYVPGKETCYSYDGNGNLISATAYIKKQTADGTWHEISSTAFYSEYVATTKEGKPNHMWSKLPHAMLAKCAESLALRKAFPADLSGIYTSEEMQQSQIKKVESLSFDMVEALQAAVDCDHEPDEIKDIILVRCGVESLEDIPLDKYNAIIDYLRKRRRDQEMICEPKETIVQM